MKSRRSTRAFDPATHASRRPDPVDTTHPDAVLVDLLPPLQPRLNALVSRIGVVLMSAASTSLHETVERALEVMVEFFEVDTSFLRRHDFACSMSVLVAEYPRRRDVPDPDPLGEVPFGSDPTFDATTHLREPLLIRPTDSRGSYQDRVTEASGVDGVSVAMVPLIRNDETAGILGFVKFGDRLWSEMEIHALQAVASLLVHLLARVEAEERLAYQAHHDELTNLPNRRSLLEELYRRTGGEGGHQIGLLLLHLDRFKAVDDAMGHDAGDAFLITVAGRLRHAIGEGDVLARLGGVEFVILRERPPGTLDPLVWADEVLQSVAAPVDINGNSVTRTASIGVSLGYATSTMADDLLAQAGAALSRSKRRGGNQATVFDEALRSSVERRFDTELELRGAISQGALLLHYQPEFDLRTGALLALEALVRWDHPQRGLLGAGEFIKVAEEAGLVIDIGRWVLAEACRQMAVWRAEYPSAHFTMRVNMSPAQLTTRNVVHDVRNALAKNGLAGNFVCLEITEHAIMQDVEQTIVVLHELRSLGVSLAIDDFGTGYSSMSQLKRLPVDVLKIDQTFVAGLGIDGRDRAIVDATVRLANSFGLAAVAEGVEEAGIVHELLSLGCYRAQGYWLCRPQPPAELAPILREGGRDPEAFSPVRRGLFAPG
jgi:diguanylate cyclase (GGDEF)-like protein